MVNCKGKVGARKEGDWFGVIGLGGIGGGDEVEEVKVVGMGGFRGRCSFGLLFIVSDIVSVTGMLEEVAFDSGGFSVGWSWERTKLDKLGFKRRFGRTSLG